MQNVIACEALLFDLDGTLINSSARIYRLWEWWSAAHGVALETALRFMHGRTAVETLRLVAPHLQAEDEIESLETEEIRDMHDVHAFAGALDLLARMDSSSWAIVTSASQRVAEARIAHVGLSLPPVLITADLVSHGKPAPECYLLAARRLKVKAENCVVIEDSPVGIQAAKAAGMHVIAIASTHPAETLRAADAVVSQLQDIDLDAAGTGITICLRR